MRFGISVAGMLLLMASVVNLGVYLGYITETGDGLRGWTVRRLLVLGIICAPSRMVTAFIWVIGLASGYMVASSRGCVAAGYGVAEKIGRSGNMGELVMFWIVFASSLGCLSLGFLVARRIHQGEIVKKIAQLPEEMKDCTILFKECHEGHGRLTATNWTETDCPWCYVAELRVKLLAVRKELDETKKKKASQVTATFRWTRAAKTAQDELAEAKKDLAHLAKVANDDRAEYEALKIKAEKRIEELELINDQYGGMVDELADKEKQIESLKAEVSKWQGEGD